jgi:Ni,Fe-hydrogenase III component G
MSLSLSTNLGTNYVAAVRAQLPNSVLEQSWQAPEQATITVTPDALPEAVSTLVHDHDGWLSVAVGNDERPLNGHFAVYYVISMEGLEKCYVTVRALVPPDSKEFPSVSPKVPASIWSERELRDMYGLRPVGLTDERRLVLSDDWPDDLFPLCKDAMDYRMRPKPTTDTETYKFINEANQPTTVLPMGPLAVGNDEPGHFRLFVDGEDIIDADYRLFYVHRGMEKAAETRMGYDEVTFLADRICGICGFTHSVAYATSVENALGIEVPPRAQTIRTTLLEVERLHSHFLNLALACHFCGFDSGFHQLFRVREKGMTLAELLTGSRKTYCLNLIGGVRRDILAEQAAGARKLIAEIREEGKRAIDILMETPYLRKRMEGVGVLDRKVARENCPVGPVVRGCGFRRDIRVDHPYAG